jgi:hypothetical protein
MNGQANITVLLFWLACHPSHPLGWTGGWLIAGIWVSGLPMHVPQATKNLLSAFRPADPVRCGSVWGLLWRASAA